MSGKGEEWLDTPLASVIARLEKGIENGQTALGRRQVEVFSILIHKHTHTLDIHRARSRLLDTRARRLHRPQRLLDIPYTQLTVPTARRPPGLHLQAVLLLQ